MIEDRGDEPIEDISIRIIGPSEGDSPQFSLPTTTGLAALVVGGGFTLEASSQDIVVCSRSDGLQQISSLNTASCLCNTHCFSLMEREGSRWMFLT